MIDLSKIKLNIPEEKQEYNIWDKSFRCPHCNHTLDLPISVNFGGKLTFFSGSNKIVMEQSWFNPIKGTGEKKKEPKKKVMESFSKLQETEEF